MMSMTGVVLLSALVLQTPAENATVSQLWPVQKEFLAMPRAARADNRQTIGGNRKEKLRYRTKTTAKPVDFAWTGEQKGVYALTVRRLPDGKVFHAATVTGLTAQVVGRLEIGRDWEWTVEAGGEKATGHFKTEDQAPRILQFDGVANARDIGGWKGLDGRRVRQGLVFRTGGLNANAKSEYYTYEEILELFRQGRLEGAGVGKNAEHLAREYARNLGQGNGIDRNFLRLVKSGPKGPGKERMTAADRAWFLGFAGVRSDIDFREDWETYGMLESPLGSKVRWFHYPMYSGYHGFVTPVGRATQAQAFSVLCGEGNYPVVFHCIGGTDRTGTFAYLLGALLGVDEEDLVRDYEMSFISVGGTDKRHAEWIAGLVKAVRNLPGKTLADKAKGYFLSLGFTDEQIEGVRKRLLEPATAAVAPSEKYAREEFARYVTQMTGQDYDGPLEIVLDSRLGKEEFVVSKRNGKLSIRGGVRGVLYGVYDVLEKFGGVRWYSSWCEKVPKSGRLVVPEGTDYSEKPAFWARLPYWIDVLKHPDFAARLRANGHLSEPLQARHGGPAYQLDKKFGFSHTFNFLVPPAEFRDSHPEYFSEIGGKRVTERTQLCLTNPEVYELVVKRLREAIAENPEADMYALAHNDYKNWCECAKCKAINDAEGNPGMTEFLFVNKVVSEIAKDHPNILFKLSAYVYTRKPPKDLKLHPNVMVDLCPIEADLIFPLPESKCKDNVAFCRDMEGWSKVRGDNFFIFDYGTSFLNLLQILPNAYTAQGNAQYYRSMGVNMVFNLGDYTGYHADFAELKAYLQAKWAWNPDLPAEPLVADFLEGYYGPAAPFVREFFDDIYARQRAHCADGTHFMTCYTPAAKELAVDGEFFRKSEALWARAKAAVKGDPTFEYNVKTSALSFEYTSLCLNAKRYFLTAHPESFGPETDAYRLAKTCVETMDEARRKRGGMVRLVEDIVRHKLRYAELVNIVKTGPADRSVKTSLIIPAKDFGRSKDFVLTNGVARFVRYNWVTALYLGNLAYDRGVRYRLRMHAKAERSADMPDGIAFKGGYHDRENKVSFERAFKASEASADWQWYEIGETEFGPRGLFWISSGPIDRAQHKENPCVDAVFVDKVEVSVCGAEGNGRDVIVYGATSAGLAAAVQARRMGLDVEIVSPTREIGGLTTGGLGATDIGNKSAIGGIAREFYRAVKEHYADPSSWRNQTAAEYAAIRREQHRPPDPDAMWTFEPSAATKILEGWVRRDGIPIRRGARLDRGKGGVTTESGRIVAIRDEDGRTYRAKTFIDATYEGDLMAAAGVSYAVGREPNAKYGEKDNGIERGLSVNHQFRPGVDPYVVKGDPKSGLLPFVEKDVDLPDGAGDGRVQAYCFRMCLTDDPSNRIPFAKPEDYDPLDYELLLRNFEAGEASPEADPQGRLMWINTPMPNRKTDTNNRTGFSTDFIGGADRWPEASYAEREEIAKRHLRYQQGLMWTLANDPRVPEHVRAEVSRWGMCRDEFPGERGDGWQNQLYVREARRMVGEYVMTEANCRRERTAARSVGLGAYGMDSHHVRRYVGADGFVRNEGNIEDWKHGGKPYPIDYGAIVPKRSECRNLLVPVCVSASHMAFGSIRMEPVFFVLGQSAATAAALAVRNGCDVQDVDYAALRKRLLADGQRLKPAHGE